ncbi:MAG: YfiR family protein [Thermonemataceae bacterium]
MKSLKLLLLFIIFTSLWASKTQAQVGDYRIQTIYIWNFTKYIQWPPNYQSGDFVIGVLGSSPIVTQLRALARTKKTVGAQRMVIKQFKTPAEIKNCHIIFIPNAESRYISAVQKAVNNFATLIVSEKSGLAYKGSTINFILLGGKWRFELNLTQAAKKGLKVSNQLTRVAVVVN